MTISDIAPASFKRQPLSSRSLGFPSVGFHTRSDISPRKTLSLNSEHNDLHSHNVWAVDSIKRIRDFWIGLPPSSSPPSDSPWSHKRDQLCVFPLYCGAFCLVGEKVKSVLKVWSWTAGGKESHTVAAWVRFVNRGGRAAVWGMNARFPVDPVIISLDHKLSTRTGKKSCADHNLHAG